jgi:hypothetical protein
MKPQSGKVDALHAVHGTPWKNILRSRYLPEKQNPLLLE